MVEWSCENKRKKSKRPLILVELSCKKERINQKETYYLIEWSFLKGSLKERGPFILVEWSCANKINNSMGAITFGRIALDKRKNK